MATKPNTVKKANPLVGKEIFILTIVDNRCDTEVFSSAFTSFRKAMNEVKTDFREKGNDYTKDCAESLKEYGFYEDGNTIYQIECQKIF